MRSVKHNSEAGMVAIVISGIIVALLALMTIGFSTFINQEVRQTTNHELSLQANYSAESGINDAIQYLQGGGTLADNTTDCGATIHQIIGLNQGAVSPDNNSAYTCMFINNHPDPLVFDNFGTLEDGQSKVFRFSSPSAPIQTLGGLLFSWQNTDGSSSFQSTPASLNDNSGMKFYDQTTWADNTGVLRVSIYPVNAAWSLDQVISNSRTYYFYPAWAAGAGHTFDDTACVDWSGAACGSAPGVANGTKFSGQCTTAPSITTFFGVTTLDHCNAMLTQNIPNASAYYIKLSAIYHPLNVKIYGEDTGGGVFKFTGAQTLVDVTGRGHDEVKREQAYVDTQGLNTIYPSFALESAESICKVIKIPVSIPAGYGGYSGAIIPPYVPSIDKGCQLPS